MITIQKKRETVAALTEKFKRASGFYLVDFMGMKVDYSIRFRRELRKKGVDYQVAKNSLIQRALVEIGDFKIPDVIFTKATGVVFAYDDPVAPAKIIRDISEKTELPKLKAAVIEGQYYDGSQLKLLASLPSKPELISGILSSLDAPISGIVGAINAVLRDVAYLV
ncbi:MAG: 50S ribosomal protein L10, partial [Ignavibacteria bacterium]|nr:50S ribosomal protein L10 [Ignavibacteria bacterium]